MNRFILLTLLQMLSLNEAYNFTCPSPAHWTIRANSRCNPPRNYTCLFDVTFRVNVYRDKCNRPRILGPGYKYVFQPNLNRATCSFTRYQPFIFETNGYSDCTFQKSFCNSLGQKTYQNGNTTVDRKCICNSYKGYTFVRNLKNQCYCNPTTEDCSCYLGINPYNTTDGLKDIKCNHEMKMTRSPYLGDMFNISRIIKIIEFNNYKYNLNHLPTNEYRIEAAKWVLILSLAYVVVWIIILSVMRRWIQTRRTPRNFNIVECTDCSVTIAWFNDVPDECISYELDHRPRGTDDWSTQTFLSEDLLDEEDGRRMYKLQNLVPETYYEFKMRSVNNDVKRHYSESKTKQTLTLGVSNDDSIIETKEEISKPLDTSVYQQCSTTEPDGVSNDDSIIETKEETGKSRETSVNQQCRTTEPDGVLNADNLIESKEEIGKPPDSSDNQQCSTTEPDGASNAEYMIETREEIGKTSDCSVHQQCSTTDPDGASNAEYMIETKEEIGKTPDCSVHQQCSTTDPDDALWCYQCGDSSIGGPCVTDTAGMKAEHYRRNDYLKNPDKEGKVPYKYLKDCLNTSKICIIERIEEQGQTHAYLRDCHNTDRSYSIQDPRFHDLEPSLNHTTCIYEKGSSKRLVCVTICDTDFCNGPQIDGGSTLQIKTWLNVICAVVMIFRQFS